LLTGDYTNDGSISLANNVVWRKITTELSSEDLVWVEKETANLAVIGRLVAASAHAPAITDAVSRFVGSLHATQLHCAPISQPTNVVDVNRR